MNSCSKDDNVNEDLPDVCSATHNKKMVYTLLAESNTRLRTLICLIYAKYGKQSEVISMNTTGVGKIYLPPHPTEILNYLKYLTMELWDFVKLYAHNFNEIMEDKSLPNLRGLYTRLQDQQKTTGNIMDICNDFKTNSTLTFNEMSARVGNDRFKDILIFARLVEKFQTDIMEKADLDYEENSVEQWEKTLSFKQKSFTYAYDLRDKYRNTLFPIDFDRDTNVKMCSVMYELCEGMKSLYDMLDKNIGKFMIDLAKEPAMLTRVSSVAKYMVLDLGSFICLYNKLNLEWKPEFLDRQQTYNDIRTKLYFSEEGGEICSVAQLIHDNPGLLANICDDIVETSMFMDVIHNIFIHKYSFPNTPYYSPDFTSIETRLESVDSQVHKHCINTQQDDDYAERQKILDQLRDIFAKV